MKEYMTMEPLTQDELIAIDGGRPSTGTSFAEDVGYVIGLIARSYYEFVTAAASFQASLPPNLKK